MRQIQDNMKQNNLSSSTQKDKSFAGEQAPDVENDHTNPGQSPDHANTPTESPAPVWKRPALLLIVAFSVWMALGWRDVVVWVDGKWQLTPERKAERDRQAKKSNRAEQYALFAQKSGYYQCPLCKDQKIFLNIGETWKYGVTVNGQTIRYSVEFLQENNLRYRVEFIGNYAECLAQEKIKLFNYPILPENLARPDSLRLILPPGNTQLR